MTIIFPVHIVNGISSFIVFILIIVIFTALTSCPIGCTVGSNLTGHSVTAVDGAHSGPVADLKMTPLGRLHVSNLRP